MRQGRDFDWDDPRARAPLTGREPLLGRLRLRLRNPTGSGWLGLSGPPGCGVSRLLEELAQASARQPGTPPALRVAPAEPGSARGEPLRRALQPWYRSASDEHLAASLTAILPTLGLGAQSLLAWLGAGPLAAAALVPPAEVLHAALSALTQGGVVLADDWEQLDRYTRGVLTDLAARVGTSVVAGHVDPAASAAAPGPCWPVDPLTDRQVALLLRRWLRSAAAVRRIAPDVARWSAGWPGRIVGIVRALARAGTLAPGEDGLRVTVWPVPEPALTPEPVEGLKRLRDQGPNPWRVVEAAALATEPLEPELLAEAAGVKRAVVERVLEEAASARSGRAPGCVFGDPLLKAYVRAHLPPRRRAQIVERLVASHARVPLERLRGLGPVLARLEAFAAGGDPSAVLGTLEPLLARLPRRVVEAPAVAELLARSVRRVLTLTLTPDAAVVLGVARALSDAGYEEACAGILGALVPPPGHAHELLWLALRVRHGEERERAAAVERLATLARGEGLSEERRYAAWRALAEADAAPQALVRQAWRETITRLPSCDVGERIELHLARARLTEHAGARRAACTHLRRAAVLLGAVGRTAEAARSWRRLGDLERALARLDLCAAALDAAARAWLALGEDALGEEALAAQAQAALDRAHFDEACALLERAQACARRADRPERLAPLALALARAHRGRGDLAAERFEAERALATAQDDLSRRLARAALLLSDVRLGRAGACAALEECLATLEASGLEEAAREVRDALADERLRRGDVATAARYGRLSSADPVARLQRARVLRLEGQDAASVALLEALGSDATVPVDLRAEAYARLAERQAEQRQPAEATRLAHAASALLEVRHRSHVGDPRVHRLLARVFRRVGENAPAIRHRLAARRALRLPAPPPGGPRERRRWVRELWRGDPRASRARTG